MDGFDYMSFIVPGLVMMSVITNSYGNIVSSFFRITACHSLLHKLFQTSFTKLLLLFYTTIEKKL